MSETLMGLSEPFRSKLEIVLQNCLAKNIKLSLVEGIRNPFVQGMYWRRSRDLKEINFKIAELRDHKAHFLAYCIEAIGPYYGKHSTDAVPGLSWHPWGRN